MNDHLFDRALVEMTACLPGFFRRRVSDLELVADLTQETLLKAYRARATLRQQTQVNGWIYGIARRTLVDHYRRRRTVILAGIDLPNPTANAAERVRAALVSSARCYLETLPSTYREAVHLAEYEGLAHREVASRLGLSLPAAKSRVRRGKLMVRRLMEASCRFEYDARGNVIGYQVRSQCCGVSR
jgi:RNA polymerase sigma-70 factor (ECF subfamily)